MTDLLYADISLRTDIDTLDLYQSTSKSSGELDKERVEYNIPEDAVTEGTEAEAPMDIVPAPEEQSVEPSGAGTGVKQGDTQIVPLEFHVQDRTEAGKSGGADIDPLAGATPSQAAVEGTGEQHGDGSDTSKESNPTVVQGGSGTAHSSSEGPSARKLLLAVLILHSYLPVCFTRGSSGKFYTRRRTQP